MSKKEQMRKFIQSHKGEEFTLTGLARELEWVTEREVGSGENKHTVHHHNTTTTLRVAKKCGASVSHVSEKQPRYQIKL